MHLAFHHDSTFVSGGLRVNCVVLKVRSSLPAIDQMFEPMCIWHLMDMSICAFVHFCISAFLHWCIGALVHWCIGAFVHWCICLFHHDPAFLSPAGDFLFRKTWVE